MTIDTAAVRRRMGAISIFRRAMDDHATITRGASVVTEIVRETVPALCDALDEERERVRVLTKYLSGFDVTEDGEVRDEDGEPYEDTFIVNIGMQAAGIKEIHAALATAGEKGAAA